MKNNNAKSFKYIWKEFNKEYDLYFQIGKYANNSNLYVGLVYYDEEIEDYESYSDLTINIPMTFLNNNGFSANKNYDIEIIINNNIPSDLRERLRDLGILKLTSKFIPSGFSEYQTAYFNYNNAKDYIIWEEK